MAANVTSTPLHKPLIIPHELLVQLDIGHMINVATLAAYAWDWLISISEEVDLCTHGKIGPPTVVYFISRFGALLFAVLVVSFNLSPVEHCQAFAYVLGSSTIAVIPFTTALFFFRVRAVYCYNKIVTTFFGLFWLAVFGTNIAGAMSARATHIGTTKICIITKITLSGSLPFALGTFFATFVFIAISIRIVSYTAVGDTFSDRTKSFVKGVGLSNLSKSLLRGGQLYYSAMVPLNILLIAMMLAPISPVYQSAFILPQVALDSCMACRVFRGLRLGDIMDIDDNASKATASCVFRRPQVESEGMFDPDEVDVAPDSVVVIPRMERSRHRENVDGSKDNESSVPSSNPL